MKPPPSTISEKAFQAQVCRLALRHGWRYAHVPAAYVRGKWQTYIAGSEGLPDLILARAGTLLLVELKSESGKKKFRPGQLEWIEEAGIHGLIWTPSDWEDILNTLTGES